MMNWRLDQACSLALSSDQDMQISVLVSLNPDHLDRFCIGLCLLREGLIESLDLVDLQGNSRLRLQCCAAVVPHRYGKRSRFRPYVPSTSIQFRQNPSDLQTDLKIDLTLDPAALGYWQEVTLQSVRDRIAQVDQFDIEANLAGAVQQIVNVAIRYPSACG
jgi:hypothetical protein